MVSLRDQSVTDSAVSLSLTLTRGQKNAKRTVTGLLYFYLVEAAAVQHRPQQSTLRRVC